MRRQMKITLFKACIVVGLVLTSMYVVYCFTSRNSFPMQQEKISSISEAIESFATVSRKYCNIYDLSKSINMDFPCMDFKTKPTSKVCLYDLKRDRHVSKKIVQTGAWERATLEEIQSLLQTDPSMGLIDIGANIGAYTLLIAAMGRQVVAIEPNRENIYRIHQAAQMSNLTHHITLLENAVSNQRMVGTIKLSNTNPGDTRIKLGADPCKGSCPLTVNTILMDDLLEVTHLRRAIIKIDIQGFEHRAFKCAHTLLDTIDVPRIYMEWHMLRNFYVSPQHVSEDKDLVLDMIHNLMKAGYEPRHLYHKGGQLVDAKKWSKWPFDLLWEKKSQSG